MEKRTNNKIYKPANLPNNSMLPGDPNGLPDESLFSKRNNALVFIDDGFLSKLSKHFGDSSYIKFNKEEFSKNLAKKYNLNCVKIFYYLAPPFQGSKSSTEENLRKESYDKFKKNLKKSKLISIFEGRCQRLKIGGKYVYKQKGVDSLIVMGLMSIPADFPDIKNIILIASDSDFVPIINWLKGKRIKVTLFTYFDKKRNNNFSRSNDLIKSVNRYKLLKKEDFTSCKIKD
ncbi:MAG: NYN domain-containing protein [archaeon]